MYIYSCVSIKSSNDKYSLWYLFLQHALYLTIFLQKIFFFKNKQYFNKKPLYCKYFEGSLDYVQKKLKNLTF